jgi:hypothetical protein
MGINFEADTYRDGRADQVPVLSALLRVLLPTLAHTSAALASYAAPQQLGTDQPSTSQTCPTQLHYTADSMPQDTEQLPATTALPGAVTSARSAPAGASAAPPPTDSVLLLIIGAAGVVPSCVSTGLLYARDVRAGLGSELTCCDRYEDHKHLRSFRRSYTARYSASSGSYHSNSGSECFCGSGGSGAGL